MSNFFTCSSEENLLNLRNFAFISYCNLELFYFLAIFNIKFCLMAKLPKNVLFLMYGKQFTKKRVLLNVLTCLIKAHKNM